MYDYYDDYSFYIYTDTSTTIGEDWNDHSTDERETYRYTYRYIPPPKPKPPPKRLLMLPGRE